MQDVISAIRTLENEGVRDPGLHRIRKVIGKGSTGTIAKLRAQFYAERNRVPAGGTNPLAEAAERMWLEMIEAIEHREQEAMEAVRRPLEEARTATETARTCQAALHRELDAANRKIEELIKKQADLEAAASAAYEVANSAKMEKERASAESAALREGMEAQRQSLMELTAERERLVQAGMAEKIDLVNTIAEMKAKLTALGADADAHRDAAEAAAKALESERRISDNLSTELKVAMARLEEMKSSMERMNNRGEKAGDLSFKMGRGQRALMRRQGSKGSPYRGQP